MVVPLLFLSTSPARWPSPRPRPSLGPSTKTRAYASEPPSQSATSYCRSCVVTAHGAGTASSRVRPRAANRRSSGSGGACQRRCQRRAVGRAANRPKTTAWRRHRASLGSCHRRHTQQHNQRRDPRGGTRPRSRQCRQTQRQPLPRHLRLRRLRHSRGWWSCRGSPHTA